MSDVAGQITCANATDCYPSLDGFDGTFAETIISCRGGACQCNLCFSVGTDGKCTLSDGCWTTEVVNEVTTCRLMQYAFFPRVYTIIFGVAAILFFLPLLMAFLLIVPSTICHRWCEKGREPPSRMAWRLLIALLAAFWLIAASIFFAGLILLLSERGSPTCLVLQSAQEEDTM